MARRVSFVDDKGKKVEVKDERWIKLESLILSLMEKIEFEVDEIIEDTNLNLSDKLIMKVNIHFNLLGRVLKIIMNVNYNVGKVISKEFVNYLIKAFDLNEEDNYER